jgi:hypothetical protein
VLTFVESPTQEPFEFHPALATTDAASPWSGLTRLASADHLRQCEGLVLDASDGTWRVLASDGRGREYPVFDLALRRVGRLEAPYLSNIPHPQLLRHPTDEDSWRLVTFDGTQFHPRTMGYGGHGDVVVMTAR